jgi:hypothetical protein
MENLRKFSLQLSKRRLLLRAALLLWAVRLGLWLLPLTALRRLLAKLKPAEPIVRANRKSKEIDKIVWAIAQASRYVPVATCLTQALAGQILLTQHGEPAILQIGVAKNEKGELQAHAWVESRGRIVIGASRELFRYTRLPSLEGKLL